MQREESAHPVGKKVKTNFKGMCVYRLYKPLNEMHLKCGLCAAAREIITAPYPSVVLKSNINH